MKIIRLSFIVAFVIFATACGDKSADVAQESNTSNPYAEYCNEFDSRIKSLDETISRLDSRIIAAADEHKAELYQATGDLKTRRGHLQHQLSLFREDPEAGEKQKEELEKSWQSIQRHNSIVAEQIEVKLAGG